MDWNLNEQAVGGLIFLLLLLLFAIWVGRRNHFFKLPPPSERPPVTWLQTLGAFLIYLVTALFVLPLLVAFLAWIFTGEIQNLVQLSIQMRGWGQILGLTLLFFLYLLYLAKISFTTRHFILWGDQPKSQERLLKSIKGGLGALLIAYPFVLLSSSVSNLLVEWLWGDIEVKQVAVNQLKMVLDYPLLFICTSLTVIFLVPFMEELLFRGFLQNLIKKYLGRNWAIALTAMLFAIVHFAESQGLGNIQLIFSLLSLSAFLGFVYEKYRSLWASITLHASFNAVNIIAILISGK